MSCSGLDRSQQSIVAPRHKTSAHTIYNYEDTTLSIYKETIQNHFLLHIEIDKAYIISAQTIKIPDIYKISHLKSKTIFLARLNTKGKIIQYNVIKKAGLGIDELAAQVLKGLTFRSQSARGEQFQSVIYITITITNQAGL